MEDLRDQPDLQTAMTQTKTTTTKTKTITTTRQGRSKDDPAVTTVITSTATNAEALINSEEVEEYATFHSTEQPEGVREVERRTSEEIPKRSHNMVGPLVAQLIR
jgi:hypothetical protein